MGRPQRTEHLISLARMHFSASGSCCEKRARNYGLATKRKAHVARIAGVNIPTAKRVPIALTYITGIGNTSAKAICEAVGIDAARRVNELSDAEVLKVREHIDENLHR